MGKVLALVLVAASLLGCATRPGELESALSGLGEGHRFTIEYKAKTFVVMHESDYEILQENTRLIVEIGRKLMEQEEAE